jgi:hypothetical protein
MCDNSHTAIETYHFSAKIPIGNELSPEHCNELEIENKATGEKIVF